MPIPKYDEMMLPVLARLGSESEGSSVTTKTLRAFVVEYFKLTDEEVNRLIPSGFERYANNMLWACTYLKHAGLIFSVKRGVYQITERGREVLSSGVSSIDKTDLMKYPEFREFIHKSNKPKGKKNAMPVSGTDESTLGLSGDDIVPEDAIEIAHQGIEAALATELLEAIMQQTPVFFERLVVRLLLAMGYGDLQSDAGFVTKQSGDEGIDGIIREDKLGFDSIYIQAKRWEPLRCVGRPELQAFVGALTGDGANKGLFITTARFSKAAYAYAEKQHAVKLVLVDGDQLAHLMIAHDVGVSVRKTYHIKGLDRDYFEGDE